MHRIISGVAVMMAAGIASAQSFNLDVGAAGAGPSATYAGAANQPGHWMRLPCTQGVTVFNLVDIHGNVTNARLSQIGGTQTLLVRDPALSGDDAILMNDFLITHTTVENCLFFRDMQPGQYDVFIYARMPAQDDAYAYTSVDQEPGFPHIVVGGAWPGQHQEFITYSRHTAYVQPSGPSAGNLYMHSGVTPGGSLEVGAVVNGVQIRKKIAGDINSDGAVNVNDLLAVINQWGACPAPPQSCPSDIFPPASPNLPSGGDGVVNVNDLLLVINNWG